MAARMRAARIDPPTIEERASTPAAAAEVDPWQVSGFNFDQRTQMVAGQVPSGAWPACLPEVFWDPWPFYCKICLESFAVDEAFQNHLRTPLHKKNADALSPWWCTECSLKFNDQSELDQHNLSPQHIQKKQAQEAAGHHWEQLSD